MKKIIGFLVTLCTVATLFAAARPSLDGRALVADAGSMPKGLFARTIGYLPGDSVAVTNPATGSTVDVLILGAIDPSEGVAILLSPEAAEKLNITKDSNVQVKITKRAGSLDETASGAAVVSESAESYEADRELAASENPIEDIGDYSRSISDKDSAVTMKSLLDEPAIAPVAVELPEEPASDEVASDEPSSENPVEPVVVVTIPAEETDEKESVIEPLPEVLAEDAPADEMERFDPFAVEDADTAEKVSVDRIVFIDAPGEPAGDAEEKPLAEDAYLDDLAAMVKASDEEVVEAEEEVVAEYVDETAPEYLEPTASEKVVLEEVPETESEDVIAVAESTEKSEEKDALLGEEHAEDGGAYTPIVLVPASENPPIAEEKPAPQADEKSVLLAPVALAAPEETAAPSKKASTEDFLVPSLKDLQSGKYYVQIASLGTSENVEGLLAKYSKKYPMVVVPLTSGKAYQVMVGPLTTDEYTVVQEKFRAFGFKDAFLRKIR